MKLTIVIDTEDEAGIQDTYKIVNHFYKRHGPRPRLHAHEVRFGKINFIKLLRRFAGECRAAEAAGDDSTGLRFSKLFADGVFEEMKDTI